MRKLSRPFAVLLTLLVVGCSSKDTDEPDAGAPAGDSPSEPDPARQDSDADGLTDGEEDANHNGKVDPGETDPARPDTDSDGLSDFIELKTSGTDPLTADTDGDTCLDGAEDRNGNGLLDPGETSPKNGADCSAPSPDTDGDGLSDAFEHAHGTNWLTPDSDCDGLLDGKSQGSFLGEDPNANGVRDPGETNPTQRDTDGDGLLDGVERGVATGAAPVKTCGYAGDADPSSQTSPTTADSDGDGLADGFEDANHNGKVDPGEADPSQPDTDGDGLSDAFEQAHGTNWLTPDSDCDGLLDGKSQGTFLGEDPNANGVRDPGETDPTQRDTDGDGLLDGVERGVATSAAPVTTCGYAGDADPSTQTSPTTEDSDDDGLVDGIEDANHNGKVDPGELNPGNGADGTRPEEQACAPQNQRQVLIKEDGGGDIRLALRPTFGEVKPISVGGVTQGFIGYDSTHEVAFIAYKRGQAGTSTTVAGDELFVRGQLNPSVTGTTQLFTSWDDHPAAQAFYEQSATSTLSAYTNALANALVGTGAGTLSGGTDVTGPFKLQAQYVHRSNASVLVVLAITPKARFVEPGLFVMGDTAGGTALAQFGDADALRCETFTTTGSGPTDFLFVVDDSGSMASPQAALGEAANAMATRLGNSQLDWRIALVTTSYGGTYSNNRNIFRGFTRDLNQFKAWLNQNAVCPDASQGCWIGTNGIVEEAHLKPARKAVNDMTAATTTDVNKRLRPEARLVVIILTDARDASTDDATPGSGNTLQEYITYFKSGNPTGKAIQLHGILCDPAESIARCNSGEELNFPVHKDAIQALGGIVGSIRTPVGIHSAINGIMDSVIGSTGYRTLKPPIGASVRVALARVRDASRCDPNDPPRSRTDGFDVDGRSQTLSFYGACRPPETGTTQAAISYRFWSDLTSNPEGNPTPTP